MINWGFEYFYFHLVNRNTITLREDSDIDGFGFEKSDIDL